jgi:para-nitrobenzyl esterase
MRVMLLTAALLISIAARSEAITRDDLVLRVESGKLQGVLDTGVRAFKNIPYAVPPVGAQRWRPPQPPTKWNDVRDATGFGPPCPTIDGSKVSQGAVLSGAYDIFMGVPMAQGASEDCLHLNVWTPIGAKKAAVMVWIQPIGPSAYPLFDGASFARDDVVMVTMDYRQLTLGNFAHPALTQEAKTQEPLSRFQTMDQLAALTWIKKNIAAFGGDPHNVTVFGESAGAASTLQLLAIPASRGLIHKAIVQSGNGWWSPFSLKQMEQLGSWAATYAGLPGADATAEQLRALPVESLPQFGIYSIDGRLQPENGTTAIASGHIVDIPLLIGWNDFDGSSLRGIGAESIAQSTPEPVKAAYATEGKSGADLGYQMYTDSHVGAPARWIATRTSRGAPTYLYLFSYVRTANRGKARGAAHGDDISYVFDTWGKTYPQLELSDEDRAMTQRMHTLWVNFAKHGRPTAAGVPEWPRYDRKSDRLMELGTTAQVRTNFRRQQLDAQEAAMPETISLSTKSVDKLLERVANGQMPERKK